MFSIRKAFPAAVFLMICVLGCAPAKELEPLTARAELESPGEVVPLVDLPVLQLEERPKQPPPEKLYTLSVRDASIQEVLLSFSRESKENIIVDPDVRGKVTVDLKNVTLKQALDALLTPLNLEYHMESGFIRVSKPKKITRLFHLNYITTSRFGSRGVTSNIAGSIGGTTGGTTGTTGTTGTATAGAVGTTGVTGGGTQGSNVSGSDRQDIFLELELALTSLGLRSRGQISTGFGGVGGGFGGGIGGAVGTTATQQPTTTGEDDNVGTFSINRMAGVVIITSYPEILAKAAELIEAIEGTVQRQVLIQAKLVEVILKDNNTYGIDWEAVFKRHGRTNTFEQKGLQFEDMTKAIKGGFATFTLDAGALDFLIQDLSEQGEVNVIANPKVSALNNQTAIIRATTRRTFFSTQTSFIQTSPGVTEPTTSINEQAFDIGVTLDVTPQISPSGVITMNIHPAVTNLEGTEDFKVGEGANEQRATAPILNVRETDTVVRVRDGETIVIGGLIAEVKGVTERKVPIFWRMPGIGKLFTSKIEEVEKNDLVIFLTPTVLLGERIEDFSIEEMERVGAAKRY